MTPLKSPHEIEALRRQCNAAMERLRDRKYSSEAERQTLIFQAFPWALRPTERAMGLRAVFDRTFGGVVLHDGGGFLTSVMTPETLWRILQEETEHPGLLRAKLESGPHSKSPRRLSDEEIKSLIRQAEADKKVRRFTPAGKELVDLPDFDDLDLDLDLE